MLQYFHWYYLQVDKYSNQCVSSVLIHAYTHNLFNILINIIRMGSGGIREKEEDEDEALTWSWVAASEDSITAGTGQKASKIWVRVFEIFVVGLIIPDGKGLLGNNKSRRHKVLRPLCEGDKCSKIRMDGRKIQ